MKIEQILKIDGVIVEDFIKEITIPVTPPTDPVKLFPCSKCTLTFSSQSILDDHVRTAHPVVPVWTRLAGEGQPFSVQGSRTVRYGAGSKWIEKVVTGSGMCTNEFFGKDPAFGVMKSCEVLSGVAPVPIPDPVPPNPLPDDPTIPHITGKIGVHWGTGGFIKENEIKEFYVNLPDGLPLYSTPTDYRPAYPKGTPYDLEVIVVDNVGAGPGSEFEFTLTDPIGNTYLSSLSENTASKRLNKTPPGRYLIAVRVSHYVEGKTSAGFLLTIGTTPALAPGDLK